MKTYTHRPTRSTSKSKSPFDVIEHMDSSSHRVTRLSTRKNAPEVLDEKSAKRGREILPKESPSKKKKEIRKYEAQMDMVDRSKFSVQVVLRFSQLMAGSEISGHSSKLEKENLSLRKGPPAFPTIKERKYNIEVEKLEEKYKNWQKKLHPDLVHSKSQREREYAAEQSARVINAYRTLTDPLSRAIYILKLENVVVDEEERITDPELLAEIMELREAVEEAEGNQALNQIKAQIQDKMQYWCKSFEDAFLNKKYEDAIASIQRMTYYKRANEEIIKKL
ncbi:Molecular chaperone HscB [Forsythia ovata]|uniref:Molecular chaperone HscB n=1 Tax=Forsythia ovata TaxID=205694 RepID=A0ABD1X7X3_9LAMI